MRKQSNTKRVFIFGDSIVKHVNKYDVSCKTDGAKSRSMTDHVKPASETIPMIQSSISAMTVL